MDTPIYSFLKEYERSGTLRLHMPGHKGYTTDNAISDIFPYDITEISGADSLFEASGIIARSEDNAAKLFGSLKTLYSCQGSTLGIQTMLALVSLGGRRIAAARNCHIAFINACALLGIDPVWIYPEYRDGSIISGEISPSAVEDVITSEGVGAVYITSPDYLGRMADIKGIAAVCKKHGVLLLVDNAHGAYLAFLEENIHPTALGADICCDSAHKTLPALTGAGYLHIMNRELADRAKGMMSLFASTSPPYPIMASLDLCNEYIDSLIRTDLCRAVRQLRGVKERLSPMWSVVETEPLKLTLYTLPSGLTGRETAELLRASGIECEYADDTHIVMMFSPWNRDEDFDRLYSALSGVRMPRIRLMPPNPPKIRPQKAMSVREAALSLTEDVPVDAAEGRICGVSRITCPPGVAVIVSGEIIDKECINILKRYSIFKVNVVK